MASKRARPRPATRAILPSNPRLWLRSTPMVVAISIAVFLRLLWRGWHLHLQWRPAQVKHMSSTMPYILATDFLRCRQHAASNSELHCCDSITLVPCEDGGRKKRLQINIKARYDAAYQSLARRATPGKVSTQSTVNKTWTIHVDRWLLHALQQQDQHRFISTDADWKQHIQRRILGHSQHFLQMAQQLKNEFFMTEKMCDDDMSALDRFQLTKFSRSIHTKLIDPVQRYKNFVNQLKLSVNESNTILRLFTHTYLPTLQEIYFILPHLCPHETQYSFSPLSLFSSLSHHAVPDEFIYLYSNAVFKVCEVYSVEYISALTSYLLYQSHHYNSSTIKILEIAAGNGRLSYFLNQEFQKRGIQMKIIASDIAGPTGGYTYPFPVTQASHEISLVNEQPDIVLCSWMPKGIDLSEAIRNTVSVKEYVLIGETDWGVSGLPNETWGIRSSQQSENDVEINWTKRWKRYNIDSLSILQVGRSDSTGVHGKSRTVAWIRRDINEKR